MSDTSDSDDDGAGAERAEIMYNLRNLISGVPMGGRIQSHQRFNKSTSISLGT